MAGQLASRASVVVAAGSAVDKGAGRRRRPGTFRALAEPGGGEALRPGSQLADRCRDVYRRAAGCATRPSRPDRSVDQDWPVEVGAHPVVVIQGTVKRGRKSASGTYRTRRFNGPPLSRRTQPSARPLPADSSTTASGDRHIARLQPPDDRHRSQRPQDQDQDQDQKSHTSGVSARIAGLETRNSPTQA